VPVPLFHVDAFTGRPFAGNPAAVCLLDAPVPAGWAAAVAAEMNLSETAFAWPAGGGRWGLRWWTPKVEVDLCGHATLATAHVLCTEGHAEAGAPIRFSTASGELTAHPDGAAVELDFPAHRRRPLSAAEREALAAVLGRAVGEEGSAAYAGAGDRAPAASTGDGEQLAADAGGVDRARSGGVPPAGRRSADALVAVEDAGAVLASTPDLAALARLPWRGLIVTAPAPDGYVLRFFGPAVGVAEDPVTGSAQCAAGPWWRERTGRDDAEVEQLSPRRGALRVRVGGDGRVRISGQAVVVARGTLEVTPASRW
jgi:predicted PhzF superfamily epimerase YddE/YHI9